MYSREMRGKSVRTNLKTKCLRLMRDWMNQCKEKHNDVEVAKLKPNKAKMPRESN